MRPFTAPASSRPPAVASLQDASALRMEGYFFPETTPHTEAGHGPGTAPDAQTYPRLDILARRRRRRARLEARG